MFSLLFVAAFLCVLIVGWLLVIFSIKRLLFGSRVAKMRELIYFVSPANSDDIATANAKIPLQVAPAGFFFGSWETLFFGVKDQQIFSKRVEWKQKFGDTYLVCR